MNRIFSLIILFTIASLNVWAQDQEAIDGQETQNEQVVDEQEAQPQEVTKEQESQDLKSQYNRLKQSAETYGEYKVFKETKLDEFWKVVNDSMSLEQKNLNENLLVIDEQSTEIENLKLEAASNEEAFQQNEFAATHINFLGINFSKSSFKIMMSIIVVGLLVILLVGYTLFNKNKTIAVQSFAELQKIESELEDLRKHSLEKQIKLNRELQTQRNKVEELRNKTTITKKISA